MGNKDELDVGTTGKSVIFTKEDFMFSARLLEGEHVDSDLLLEGEHVDSDLLLEGEHVDSDLLLDNVRSAFTILTDAAALYDAVSSVTVVADEQSALSLRFADNRIKVSCEGEGCSSARELEVVALSGTPEGEYWYNPRQLSQCLAALGGTLMLEAGQNGILVMRTDDLTCLQLSRRKPSKLRAKEEETQQKTVKAAA